MTHLQAHLRSRSLFSSEFRRNTTWPSLSVRASRSLPLDSTIPGLAVHDSVYRSRDKRAMRRLRDLRREDGESLRETPADLLDS